MYLSQTQKNELLDELRYLYIDTKEIESDIEKNGAEAECLDFTDVDNQQVCIKISDDVYIYSQQNKMFYDWYTDDKRDVGEYKTDTIILEEHTTEEIESMISGFYDSLDDLKTENGEKWKQIVCECIFEDCL